MKSKIGIIFTIILLLLLVVALTTFFITYLVTGRTFWGSLHIFSNKSTNTIFNTTFALEDVNEISLSQEYGDITIQESSDNTVRMVVYGEDADQLDWNLDEQKLEVQSIKSPKYVLFPRAKCDMVLYLPTSFAGQISLKTNCGTCNIADFNNASFTIDCDAGNLKMGKVKEVTARCDCGNMTIQEISNQCSLRVDAGNIEIEKLSLQENSSIRVDMGNITVEKSTPIYIDASVDLGNKNIEQNNRNSSVTLSVDCNCGNIFIGK